MEHLWRKGSLFNKSWEVYILSTHYQSLEMKFFSLHLSLWGEKTLQRLAGLQERGEIMSGHFFKDSISMFERHFIGLVGIEYHIYKSLQSAYLEPNHERWTEQQVNVVAEKGSDLEIINAEDGLVLIKSQKRM